MRSYSHRILLGGLALVLLLSSIGQACTVFSYADDEIALFGNNEDYHLTPHIWFVEPRGDYHGVLCLGFDYGATQGAMNTAGLCYDATAGTSHILNWHKELPDAPSYWPSLIMQLCATVDEVETFMRKYDYSTKGMAQFLFFDRNGDSLIVASTHQGEVAYLKKSGGARTITNFNVTDHAVGTYPCWRYDTAWNLLRKVELGDSTASVDYFRSILNGVHQPGYTTYSNIFNPRTLTAIIYRNANFRDPRVINLEETLEQGPPGYMTLEEFFERTRDE